MLRSLVCLGVVVGIGCSGSVAVDSYPGSGPNNTSPGSGAGICVPGKFRCQGLLLEQCTDQGDRFEPVHECPVTCDAVSGTCGVCIPDRQRCASATSFSVCAEDGLSEAAQPCPQELPFCFEGSCVECLDASVCPQPSAVCHVAACAEHSCAQPPAPPGTPCSSGKECTTGGLCCVVSSVEAKLWPLDIYFMLDRSGSMEGELWNNQAAALQSFFSTPTSGDVSVALRFFPLDNKCVAQDSKCSGEAYQEPLVPWGVLPGHSTALQQALDKTDPTGCFTPTEEALHGVLRGARNRKMAYPDHVVVAVLVSDGGPCCEACPVEGIEGLGHIAGEYLASSPSIPTFAIFVNTGASKVMAAIAEHGGTSKAFDASSGTQSFVHALKQIQAESIPCKLQLSTQVLFPDTASLEYSPSNGGPSYLVPRAATASDCDQAGDWYFDDPVSPNVILLCPQFCEQLKQDVGSTITVFLECN